MTEDRFQSDILIESLLNRTLSEEAAAALLEQMKADDEIRVRLQLNTVLDHLLTMAYSEMQEERRLFTECGHVHSFCDSFSNLDDLYFPGKADPEVNTLVIWPYPIEYPSNSVWSRHTQEDRHSWQAKSSFRKRLHISLNVVGCVLLLVSLSFALYFLRSGTSSEGQIEPTARAAETIDAVWESGTTPFRRGEAIWSNELSLKSGLAMVRFKNGAEITLEGPSKCVINGKKSVFCGQGSMSIHIPASAIGFEVVTPFGSITDRGTDFYVRANNEALEVQTINGLVEFTTLNDMTTPLPAGNGIKAVESRIQLVSDRIAEGYIGTKAFLSKLFTYTQKQIAVEKERSLVFDKDPSLLGRFDFSQVKRDSVVNTSQMGSKLCPEISLSRYRQTEGVYFNTKALALDSRDSCAQLDMPGSWDSVTLIATIRIDQFRNWGNVVFASSSKLNERGNFIWQITKQGELHFLLKSSSDKQAKTFGSPSVFKRRFWGTWVEIALVADAKQKKIYHYMDGQQVSVHDWNSPVPLITKQASVGNLFDHRGRVNDRFLGGSISELLIYKRALSLEELAARQTTGKNNP